MFILTFGNNQGFALVGNERSVVNIVAEGDLQNYTIRDQWGNEVYINWATLRVEMKDQPLPKSQPLDMKTIIYDREAVVSEGKQLKQDMLNYPLAVEEYIDEHELCPACHAITVPCFCDQQGFACS
jgi:hypothetical protein